MKCTKIASRPLLQVKIILMLINNWKNFIIETIF